MFQLFNVIVTPNPTTWRPRPAPQEYIYLAHSADDAREQMVHYFRATPVVVNETPVDVNRRLECVFQITNYRGVAGFRVVKKLEVRFPNNWSRGLCNKHVSNTMNNRLYNTVEEAREGIARHVARLRVRERQALNIRIEEVQM